MDMISRGLSQVTDLWVTSGDYSGHDQPWVIDDGLQTHG